MFCPECGKEIEEGLDFCPNCGATLTANNFKSNEVNNSNYDNRESVNQQIDYNQLADNITGKFKQFGEYLNVDSQANVVENVGNSLFVDSDEEVIDSLGNGWIPNLLLHRKIRKSNIILTDKRLYLQGHFVTAKNKLSFNCTEQVVNIEDVTGTRFLSIGRSIVAMVVAWVYFSTIKV